MILDCCTVEPSGLGVPPYQSMMGIETFDPVVIESNALTCTPSVLMRAVEHVNEAGAERGPSGLSKLLLA
ncbi:MAG: hypothetical protein ACRDZ4_12565 [Egibacteraceae bacterium]